MRPPTETAEQIEAPTEVEASPFVPATGAEHIILQRDARKCEDWSGQHPALFKRYLGRLPKNFTGSNLTRRKPQTGSRGRTIVNADYAYHFFPPMSWCVRRAFPFRTDMRAIQYSQELTIVQNQTWGTSTGRKTAPAYVLARSQGPRSCCCLAAAADTLVAVEVIGNRRHNDNQDQFHEKPPLVVLAYFAHRILRSADCLAGLETEGKADKALVAEDFPGGFFHGTFEASIGLMPRRILSQTAHSRSYNYNCVACLF
jgi:hypothetical protein